jgi:hypothetical protein
MGFAWEPSNVGNSGGLEPVDRPPPSPRHRKPARRPGPGAAAHARGAVTAIAAASRRARTLIATRPSLVDHRRAF